MQDYKKDDFVKSVVTCNKVDYCVKFGGENENGYFLELYRYAARNVLRKARNGTMFVSKDDTRSMAAHASNLVSEFAGGKRFA